MNRYIDTTNENGTPCKAVVIDDMEILTPYESECGRFEVADPVAHYGLTQAEVAFLEEQRIRLENAK